MWATSDGPRIEDFGITETDLARAPKLFFPTHRVMVLFVAYLMVSAVVFLLIVETSHSISAAAFFTIVILAAGSVLLLPTLILLVCVGERAEERWLCRRVPMLRACLAYQRAVDEHRRLTDRETARPLELGEWCRLPQASFRRQLQSELDRRFRSSISEFDRERFGIDCMIELAERRVIVRYEAGELPVAASVGRELVAAMNDLQAGAAVIVTAAKSTRTLEDYIVDRPIRLVAPWALDALETSLS
jgi:hypothetical protein